MIALLVGLPLLFQLFTDYANFAIHLGEYITIPWYIAFPLLLGLMVVPFALAVPWALNRVRDQVPPASG